MIIKYSLPTTNTDLYINVFLLLVLIQFDR